MSVPNRFAVGLGLIDAIAGLDAEALRRQIEANYTDAVPLVGRDLSPLVLGRIDPDRVDEPLYYMTDDDPSRGLNQVNFIGINYDIE
jgi:choline-sulfatase